MVRQMNYMYFEFPFLRPCDSELS